MGINYIHGFGFPGMKVENNKMAKIRKVVIKPDEVVQIVHPATGTVLSIVVDLESEYMHIKHESYSDGLGLSWDGRSERLINSMLDGE
jgi:hypothetical protein